MPHDTHHPAAVAIANWWADHLFGGTIGDTGDRSEGAGFTMALAVVAGVQGRPADPSKRDMFVDALARRVTDELARRIDRPEWAVTLSVDYGPDPMLADAAAEAGARGSFPWKTVTWTYLTHVVASLGYGGRDQVVWSVDGWDRPVCGVRQYGKRPESPRLPWRCSAPRYHDGDHVFDTPDPLCQAHLEIGTGSETCNRSASHDWHAADGHGYMSKLYHEFKAGV